MEKRARLEIKISKEFLLDLDQVFQFGSLNFSQTQAIRYEEQIWTIIETLNESYLLFPECRHLPTKSKKYRWIILEAHLLIYRIQPSEVQVLRLLHSHRSITGIKSARRLKL